MRLALGGPVKEIHRSMVEGDGRHTPAVLLMRAACPDLEVHVVQPLKCQSEWEHQTVVVGFIQGTGEHPEVKGDLLQQQQIYLYTYRRQRTGCSTFQMKRLRNLTGVDEVSLVFCLHNR